MSMEIDNSLVPPSTDVRTEAPNIFAEIDLRSVYLNGLTSGEFSSDISQSLERLSDADFVSTLYSEILQREVEPGGAEFWVQQLAAGATREDLLEAFITSEEALSLSTPEEISLLGQYFSALAPQGEAAM